ncbi:hypothetical protein Kpol_1044p16 [Vanderwaltozyma polyspora DSM 70294]|uniref:Uncharacterized protein n=1 Tax=Vanderwaltozyma polyspora (strain ATCC 22028 / DSM 70294 / BCRC 21397 / CBS 2163 / NBRC 10782 / NRRL Y-8283 / UCD 57-17) TaxID=436907 RepID=A7TP47_VANPO|nr:uncharacterized protein Kpol_1044p16 [Vanderwaltozyma polyspora DSM 70294]EDO15957.1 hypothetical protein Kpol_1044p16 [Vanderwaltozyma polyspora DSM 70294]
MMNTKDIAFTLFYLFFIQGFISGIVGGGVEFGIAYGMYHNSKNLVKLWSFPNTLSGDCALTFFVQIGVTWVLGELMVGWDCYNNKACKLPDWLVKEKPDRHIATFKYLFFEPNRGLLKDDPNYDEEDYGNPNSFLTYLKRNFFTYYPNKKFFPNLVAWAINKIARGLIFSVPIFCIVWPVTMGILAGIGHKIGKDDYYFNHKWTPQTAKLIFGFVVGIISAPVVAMVVILRNEWYRQDLLENNLPQNDIEDIEKAAAHNQQAQDDQLTTTSSSSTVNSSFNDQLVNTDTNIGNSDKPIVV